MFKITLQYYYFNNYWMYDKLIHDSSDENKKPNLIGLTQT
jgi:hypothetical protein